MGIFSSKIKVPKYKDGVIIHDYEPKNKISSSASSGEQKVAEVLRLKNIPFISEFHHPNLKWLRYDFCFSYCSKCFLLEFDGFQHFNEHNVYTNNIQEFHALQDRDRLKAQLCKWLNIYHIRIDYTQLRYIEFHIRKALHKCDLLYLSTPSLYSYLKEPSRDTIKQPNRDTISRYLVNMPAKCPSQPNCCII